MGEARGSVTTGQRDRSPSFPFIPLKTAVERLTAFEEHHKRAPTSPDRIGPAWEMRPNSSQAAQTIAALKAYGLLEPHRGENGARAIIVSEDGRTYLRAQQDSIKRDVLRRAALRPKQIEMCWRDWGADRPADAACLDHLVLSSGFSKDGADKFLRVYDATIGFAGLAKADKIAPIDRESAADIAADLFGGEGKGNVVPPPPPPTVKVGDYVQWTSGGIDQLKEPRRVTRAEDGHVFVHGSLTGLPMAELTVVDPPTSEPARMVQKAAKLISGGRKPVIDANVLISGEGTRLQITADVDLNGLKLLREMISKYEEMLT
jgi:hypothetical protein